MNTTSRLIRTFCNGQSLEFDTGGFDEWCTYIRNPDGTRKPLRDFDYFSDIVNLGNIYGFQRIFLEIKKIYILTGKEIDERVLKYISLVSEEYATDSLGVEILFSILYAAFIAEENRAKTKLGKRIKLLGIHQILMEGIAPEIAANFSRGMSWQNISKLCEERGF